MVVIIDALFALFHMLGNSRSITKSEIKKQIETLVLNGIKEVVLTGVDITSWGLDFEKKND